MRNDYIGIYCISNIRDICSFIDSRFNKYVPIIFQLHIHNSFTIAKNLCPEAKKDKGSFT